MDFIHASHEHFKAGIFWLNGQTARNFMTCIERIQAVGILKKIVVY